MGDRCGAVVRDDHPLARGQAVILDDVRRSEIVQGGLDLGESGAHGGARGGHARGGHDLLGEGLAALQSRRLRGRSKACDATRAHGVSDSRNEWSLGTDDDEIRADRGREISHRSAVERIDRMDPRILRDAGVAGRDVHFTHLCVTSQGARQGVLAGTGPDDQGDHKERA